MNEHTAYPDHAAAGSGGGPLANLAAALRDGRLLVVWADAPFPPQERSPARPALEIAHRQAAAASLPPLPWPLPALPPLPILSLDPSRRVEDAFACAGVRLQLVRSRRDVPVRGMHSLLKLGGDLAERAGLFLSWGDVGAAVSEPDKAYLLAEAGRWVEGGALLVLAPDPGEAFPRFWRELLAPALRGAAHALVLGPAGFPWPAPLQPLEVDFTALVAALVPAAPPPAESAEAASLRRQLTEARVNLQLIEERESQFVLATDIPLQLIKEKRRLLERIAKLERQLAGLGVGAEEQDAVGPLTLPPDQLAAIHDKLDRLLADHEGLRQGQAAIYRRLDAAQQQTVGEVLAWLRQARLDDAETTRELSGMLDGIRRALSDLQARQLPALDADVRRALDEVTETLRAGGDLRSGLELTVPLIPLLLSYRLSLEAGTGLDLRQAWENLLAWARRKEER